MYGSVPQYDERDKVWVKDASAHLKGSSICLMYACPKILSFIASMGLKVQHHFRNVFINTLQSVFVQLHPTTTFPFLS